MKSYKFVLMAGLLVAGFSEAYAANPVSTIKFSTPSSFTCGESVSWNTLTDWKGEDGKCGQGTLYTVVGEVSGIAEGYVEATIVVPEDNDKEWPAYNGKKHRIINHRFEVSYCITTKDEKRPIRIQAHSNDGQAHGQICVVTITGQ